MKSNRARSSTQQSNVAVKPWIQVAVGVGLVAVSWWLYSESRSRTSAAFDPRAVLALICFWTGFPIAMLGLNLIPWKRVETDPLEATARDRIEIILVLIPIAVVAYLIGVALGQPAGMAMNAGMILPIFGIRVFEWLRARRRS